MRKSCKPSDTIIMIKYGIGTDLVLAKFRIRYKNFTRWNKTENASLWGEYDDKDEAARKRTPSFACSWSKTFSREKNGCIPRPEFDIGPTVEFERHNIQGNSGAEFLKNLRQEQKTQDYCLCFLEAMQLDRKYRLYCLQYHHWHLPCRYAGFIFVFRLSMPAAQDTTIRNCKEPSGRGFLLCRLFLWFRSGIVLCWEKFRKCGR